MYLKCVRCGKVISSEVPDGTVVRAYLECPECVEKFKDMKCNCSKCLGINKEE